MDESGEGTPRPRARALAPNLLIMSAGFDAAETDLGNVGVDRRGERKVGVNLQPKDYEEMTARLVEAVESVRRPSCCGFNGPRPVRLLRRK